MKIKMYDVASGSTTEVDQALRFMHGGCERFSVSWSPDSRWFAYNRDLNNYHNAAYIYDFQNKKTQQVTNGYYNCSNAVFDTEGKYLYVTTINPLLPIIVILIILLFTAIPHKLGPSLYRKQRNLFCILRMIP